MFGLDGSTFLFKFSLRFLTDFTLDANVDIRRAMTSRRSAYFEKDQISSSDQYGHTANIRRGLNTKTHFLRLDGIGGRVVLADHPERDTKKVILNIDRLEYSVPEK